MRNVDPVDNSKGDAESMCAHPCRRMRHERQSTLHFGSQISGLNQTHWNPNESGRRRVAPPNLLESRNRINLNVNSHYPTKNIKDAAYAGIKYCLAL